jgi:putative transposase
MAWTSSWYGSWLRGPGGEGLKLTGEDSLLGRLTKVVVESALEGEMDDHLGYGKHDSVGRNGGNSRNGTRPKTLVTPGRSGGD